MWHLHTIICQYQMISHWLSYVLNQNAHYNKHCSCIRQHHSLWLSCKDNKKQAFLVFIWTPRAWKLIWPKFLLHYADVWAAAWRILHHIIKISPNNVCWHKLMKIFVIMTVELKLFIKNCLGIPYLSRFGVCDPLCI